MRKFGKPRELLLPEFPASSKCASIILQVGAWKWPLCYCIGHKICLLSRPSQQLWSCGDVGINLVNMVARLSLNRFVCVVELFDG